MKVIKPQKLGVVSRCFERRRRFWMSIGVLALHRFSGALASEVELWKFVARELGQTPPDAAMPKSRGEFLVTGRAFQPGGGAGPACRVRVRLGGLEKELYVFGNRYWIGGAEQSQPEPFVDLPIAWETAFGGAGFVRNPLGKGCVPVDTQYGPLHPLPNVEHPDWLVRSPHDRPEPAGLGAIDLMWPQRAAKAGTHDARWFEEQFPGYATDIDWSIFNIAPADQQQDHPFVGDEPFAIEGMHPGKPRLTGSLPGIAARCLVNQRVPDGESLQEVQMRLTTVWFYPHAERLLLVFHGVHEVGEDDAADILQLLVGAERVTEPREAAHYERVRTQRLDPEYGAFRSLCDADLLPSMPAGDDSGDEAEQEAGTGMAALLATEDLMRKHRRVAMERAVEKARASVAARGLDPDLYAPLLPPPEEPLPSLEELPEFTAKIEAEADRRKVEAEQQRAQKREELRRSFAAHGLDDDAILAKSQQPPAGPPHFRADEELLRLRALCARSEAMGCPIEGLNRRTQDPQFRQQLIAAETNQREGYRQAAHHQGAAPRLSGTEAARSRAAALATLKQRGNLARQDLTGFDLSDLDLRGLDLSGAWLENANLARSNLEGAGLSEAVLARADLTDANLADADLRKANLGLAQIIRTKAQGALLSEAILGKACIADSSFQGANFDSADFMETELSTTDLSRASLAGLIFLKAQLKGLCLAGANLKKATFIETEVSGLDFTGACLEGATIVKCRGDGAIMASANLTNARFVQECSFAQVDFRGAVLEGANLRGTGLAGCDFSAARLDGADLSECDLTRARFEDASARNALFVRSNLVEAVLVGADLMNAILQKADLREADLRGASLFQADLARVQANRQTNLQQVNTKKMRIHPMRTRT